MGKLAAANYRFFIIRITCDVIAQDPGGDDPSKRAEQGLQVGLGHVFR
jgi:hypothetical protein